MKPRPLISVLIPTYNRPSKLKQALASTQYFGKNIEVIVGNNGDTLLVEDVIDSLSFGVPVKILNNPPGSTYPDNLRVLLGRASGEWITILHDDDFFAPEVKVVIPLISKQTDIDFIFSDHILVDENSNYLPLESVQNSKHYGRSSLIQGVVRSPQLLAVEQSICLDCFFVRSSVAAKCSVEFGYSIFADILLLAQMVQLSRCVYYFSDTLFAYRVNDGLTSRDIPQDELLRSLQHCRKYLDQPDAQRRMRKRIYRQGWNSLRFSIKRLKISSVFKSILAILKTIR